MMGAALSALCLTLMGCAGTDSVLFVTTTTIGIDADSKPPKVSIGYDRYEGYIGPAYSTGAVPPVVAKIDSNLKIFNPEIRQLYATGDAARLVTQKIQPDQVEPDGKMYSNSGRVMLFGTGANIGLKVTFAGNMPESIAFGYKRKEFSYIPLGSVPDQDDPSKMVDKYGSVLALMDMRVKTTTFSETGLSVTQFFATGDAAKNLAARKQIRDRFALEADAAIAAAPVRLARSDTGDRLAERALEDAAFRQKLADWMQSKNITVTMTEFFYGESFEEQRQQAAADLML